MIFNNIILNYILNKFLIYAEIIFIKIAKTSYA
jgi:hypothetical protein